MERYSRYEMDLETWFSVLLISCSIVSVAFYLLGTLHVFLLCIALMGFLNFWG